MADDDETTSLVDEPQDYWEQEAAANQIAKFDHGGGLKGDDIPMLVAVRVRPLWDKVRSAAAPSGSDAAVAGQCCARDAAFVPRAFVQEMEAGDYSTVRVLENKVVVVLDPWYDADLNPNRAKEKKYAFDVVFDVETGQDEVYQQTARGLVGGVLDGYNSSVFAYGATGAGKTVRRHVDRRRRAALRVVVFMRRAHAPPTRAHCPRLPCRAQPTMLGSLEQPGIMVNTLHDMFQRMKDASFADAKFKVTLSYVEICARSCPRAQRHRLRAARQSAASCVQSQGSSRWCLLPHRSRAT
jgi:hypothetical protein